MTTIINPRRINRTIVVERDSRTLTARVIDALDAPNGMAEMLAGAEAARDDAQQAVTDAQVIKDGLLDDLSVTANTLAPGEPATAAWDGDTQLLTLGIPEGQPGDVSGMVRFDTPQTLTAPQQAQARDNIGAADSATAVVNTRTIAAGTGLTGGGDLTADRTIAADFASEAEALAGTATDKVMSPARVHDALTWRQVAYVPVTATAAITLTGLDFDGETLILLSGLTPNAGAANWLTIARSTDNGATWDTAYRYSVAADWVTNSLLGTFHARESGGGTVYLDAKTSASNLATANTYYQNPPLSTTFSATTNALRFAWSGAGRDFAAGGYITVLKRG